MRGESIGIVYYMKIMNLDFKLTSGTHKDNEVIYMCMASDSYRLKGKADVKSKTLCAHCKKVLF